MELDLAINLLDVRTSSILPFYTRHILFKSLCYLTYETIYVNKKSKQSFDCSYKSCCIRKLKNTLKLGRTPLSSLFVFCIIFDCPICMGTGEVVE
jgi:hypothetical protein